MKIIYLYALCFLSPLLLYLYGCKNNTVANNKNQSEENLSEWQKQKTLELMMLNQKSKTIHDSLASVEIESLEHGDIILRKGYGWVSDLIAVLLEEKYIVTHCGFVVKDSLAPHKIAILHTVNSGSHDGMLLEPLESFIRDSQEKSLAIVRPKYSREIRQAAVREGMKFLAAKIPFDMEFDDKDNSKFYCAEMIRQAFLPVIGKDILPKRIVRLNKEGTPMSNFFDTLNFEVILNHNEEKL